MPEIKPVIDDDISAQLSANRTELSEEAAGNELILRAKNNAPPKEEKEKEEGDGFLAGAAKGAVETLSGRAPVHGAINAVNEVIDLREDLEKTVLKTFGQFDIEKFEYTPPSDFRDGKAELPEYANLPNLPEPESAVGKMAAGISQFLVGFFGAGKLKAFKAIQPVGKLGKGAKLAAQGAVADFAAFDPHEARLSDLIESFPALSNPVTSYLQSNDEDIEAEGRFKNAIEGLGLGVITDGFVMSLKMLRKAAIAKRQQLDDARIAGGTEDIRPEVADDAFDELGEVTEEAPIDTRVSDDAVDAADDAVVPDESGIEPKELLKKKPGEDGEIFINFARIDEPDDVKALIEEMAEASKGDINTDRRGAHRGFKQVELDAKQVDAWETLKNRRKGDALNPEQTLAARQLWASSAEKLQSVAKKAAQSGNEADLFAFRKMLAVHKTIQSQVIAARTETARALASWRIPAGSGAEKFAAIDNVLTANGGTRVAREMAERVSLLAENGMTHEMEKFIELGAWAKTRNAMLEYWINALLSGPKTHFVNALSNTSVVFQQMYERKAASKIAEYLGDAESVQLGESLAQYNGMVNGIKDALRYSAKSFMTGESGFGLNKVELPGDNSISSEALGIASDGLVGRAVDVIGAGVNLPTRSLGAADEFFKTIGYRMELNALALRKASQEVNSGAISADQLKQRMSDIIDNPPDDIRLDAIDQATYQTFTNTPGELAKLIQKAKGKFPALNVLLPFVRTPANIMTYTFQRTPLAPLFKQFRADVSAGGARRDIALARMSTGTALMMMTADMAMNDVVTGKGPSNRAERQALQRKGWQQYSVKIGDRSFAYNRADPLGMTMGLAADMVEILANDEFGVEKEKDFEELAIATSMAIANNAMSKTYLTGMSDFIQAVSDPERFGESFAQRLSGSLVPAAVAEVARFNDPYMVEVNSMVDAMRKRTPGLTKDLPARRNLWGEAITYQSGLGVMYDAFSPIYSTTKKISPIDDAILEHEMNITMPNKKTGFNGVTVNLEKYPGAYSRYVQLSGNEAIHPAWNMGAKDYLNELVSGKHSLSPVYDMKSNGPDGGKYFMVRDSIQQFRELAKQQLLIEYPEIKEEIDDKKEHKRSMKMPSFGG